MSVGKLKFFVSQGKLSILPGRYYAINSKSDIVTAPRRHRRINNPEFVMLDIFHASAIKGRDRPFHCSLELSSIFVFSTPTYPLHNQISTTLQNGHKQARDKQSASAQTDRKRRAPPRLIKQFRTRPKYARDITRYASAGIFCTRTLIYLIHGNVLEDVHARNAICRPYTSRARAPAVGKLYFDAPIPRRLFPEKLRRETRLLPAPFESVLFLYSARVGGGRRQSSELVCCV